MSDYTFPEQCAAAAHRLATKLEQSGYPVMTSVVGMSDPADPATGKGLVLVARGPDALLRVLEWATRGGVEAASVRPADGMRED